jgi:hypothetical protein
MKLSGRCLKSNVKYWADGVLEIRHVEIQVASCSSDCVGMVLKKWYLRMVCENQSEEQTVFEVLTSR